MHLKGIRNDLSLPLHKNINFFTNPLSSVIYRSVFNVKNRAEIYKMKLFKHQIEVLPFIEKHRYVILRHDPGVGKTIASLNAANHFKAEAILITCPAYLIAQWWSEVDKFFPEMKKRIQIRSYFSKTDFKEKFDFMVFDEVQKIKNVEAKITIHAHNLIEANKPDYCLMLSGTPIKNRVTEWFSVLTACSIGGRETVDTRKYFKSQWQFSNYFSNAIKLKISGRSFTKFDGVKNVETLKKMMVGKIHTVKMKDVIDLPELIIKDVFIDMEEDKEVEKDFDRFQETGKVHFSTAKKLSAINKSDYTIKYLEDLIDGIGEEDRIVVFSDHIEPPAIIARALKCPLITGCVSNKERDKYFEEFKSGKHKVICGTIGAMGTGLNLTLANHVVFNDICWVPSDLEQAIARIYRIGQGKKCVAHTILGGKIDARIYKTVKEKVEILKII